MKQFTMRDEGFICENCGAKVIPLNYTARDHCPYCLCSKHVDVMPGDRSNDCKGLLEPIGIEKFKDTYKIVYQCQKCKMMHKNIVAIDDDMDKIIELTVNLNGRGM
jgi:DNA-directed RNA polymerase subunit RPC12/RpoP